jgi:hypothetical protein
MRAFAEGVEPGARTAAKGRCAALRSCRTMTSQISSPSARLRASVASRVVRRSRRDRASRNRPPDRRRVWLTSRRSSPRRADERACTLWRVRAVERRGAARFGRLRVSRAPADTPRPTKRGKTGNLRLSSQFPSHGIGLVPVEERSPSGAQ